jgi:predicted DsbA family dithiol-disulfide isomerase
MADLQVAPGTVVCFSDVGCPWASLAVHRFRRRRHELGLDDVVTLDPSSVPLELFNDQVTPKTIVDGETAVIGSHEPSLQWHPWLQPECAYPSSTLLPLAAVQAAKHDDVGGLAAAEELDAALRHAWYAHSRSIHVFSELLNVAAACSQVTAAALDARLRAGAGFAEVFAGWQQAKDLNVQGSPHLFVADGYNVHNPGIEMHRTAEQFSGFPVIDSDDPSVYDEILTRAARSR